MDQILEGRIIHQGIEAHTIIALAVYTSILEGLGEE